MGLVGLSNVLAVEGAKYNITSNVIAPLAKTRLTEELLGALADRVAPERVTPLVTYLVSEGCELTHEVFSVGGGRYARVFVGLAPGWFAGKDKVATAEEVRDHIDVIRKPEGYIVPTSIADEMKIAAEQLGG